MHLPSLSKTVQMRTRIMNQLQALAMNENKRWKEGAVDYPRLAKSGWRATLPARNFLQRIF